MSKKEFNEEENLNVGFRDIFMNSAVACILLFFIFSAQSGLMDFGITSKNSTSGNGERNYAFEAKYSKAVEKSEVDGTYQSIIGVELQMKKGLLDQKKVDNLIENGDINWVNNEGFEEFYFFNSYSQKLMLYLVLGESTKNKIKLKFSNNPILKHYTNLKGFMIDGSSSISSNKIKYYQTEKKNKLWSKTLLAGKEVSFQAVKVDRNDSSINMDKAITIR